MATISKIIFSQGNERKILNTGKVFSKRIEIIPQIHIRKFEEQTA
jgi:hypothetical protein